METNNHQINDYSAVLERKYGKKVQVSVLGLTKRHILFIRVRFLLKQEKKRK